MSIQSCFVSGLVAIALLVGYIYVWPAVKIEVCAINIYHNDALKYGSLESFFKHFIWRIK